MIEQLCFVGWPPSSVDCMLANVVMARRVDVRDVGCVRCWTCQVHLLDAAAARREADS